MTVLVDLPKFWAPDGSRRDLATLTGGLWKPDRVQQGVYLAHLNFFHDIRGHILTEYPFSDDKSTWNEGPWEYGVCDNYHQILAQWPLIESSPRRFLISLAEIRRANQPPRGGWRWHKWGPYIGKKTPTTEYLDDEPEIDHIFVYHIYEKKQ